MKYAQSETSKAIQTQNEQTRDIVQYHTLCFFMGVATTRDAERVGKGLECNKTRWIGKQSNKMADPFCVQFMRLKQRQSGGMAEQKGLEQDRHKFGELRGGQLRRLLMLGQFAKLR